jgi:hypothetical protein
MISNGYPHGSSQDEHRPSGRRAISDNWNHLMRPHDMKYIGFKHQRENKQNSDKSKYC